MGRKRKGVPVRLDAAKQLHLAWKMTDMTADAVTIVPNNDPSLQQESEHAGAQPKASTSAVSQKIQNINAMNMDSVLSQINQREFCLRVRSKVEFKETEWHCHLGSFYLNVQEPNSGSHQQLPSELPRDLDLWLYVSSEPDNHLIYFECEDPEASEMIELGEKRVMYFQASAVMPYEFLDGLKWKALPLEIGDYCSASGKFEIKILATEAAMIQLQFSSESIRSKKVNLSIQRIMSELHGFPFHDFSGDVPTTKPDVKEFYQAIKEHHEQEKLSTDINVQHTNLRPRLRQYQKEAVVWMLHRENVKQDAEKLHCLYQEFQTVDGQMLYYNRYGGYLVKKKPVSVKAPPGGILADEMGLGKTVEVLACMMSHPRRNLPELEELPVIMPDSESSSDEEVGEACKEVQNGRRSSGENIDINCKNKTEDMEVKQQSGVQNMTPETEGTGADSVNPPASTVYFDHDYCNTTPQNNETNSETTDKHSQGNSPVNKGKSQISKNKKEGTVTNGRRKRQHSKDVVPNGEIREHNDKQMRNDEQAAVNDVDQQDNDVEKQVASSAESPSTSFLTMDRDEINPDTTANDQQEKKSTKRKPRERKKVGYVIVDEGDEMNGSGFFDEASVKQKASFECICGLNSSVEADKDEKSRVQCLRCGLWQHPECVKYDLRDPYRGQYLCPHCHVISSPVPSGATLIISPNSICHQWVDEIRKHIHRERLKVLVYGGVHAHGFLQPQFLARHDIVITSYETLQKEINYVDLPHSNSQAGRRFRHPKRFMAVPSPMVAVEWWRICLDEAQMVECTTTKSAEMALRLSAVNRWCVTGTPIQKGLDDLYGLLLFLGEDPYWVQTWWSRLLLKPYCLGEKHRMHDFMAKVMWRTSKDDVIDQICLPTQSEEVHWLTFSPIEDHFYKRTFSQCARVGLRSLSKWQDGSVKLNTVDRYTLHALLGPLTKIRQACCHPQAVRGSFLPVHRSTMTMEELLVSMTKKARLECEEAHRQLNAAMNGLAGLHIIRGEYEEAVDMYREVLRSIVEHGGQFRTDPLQQLHTLQNLDEVLNLKPAGVAPTLRDSKLKEEAAELRQQYLLKVAGFVEQAAEAWRPLRTSLRSLRTELAGDEDWWADLLQGHINMNSDELLVERVKTELLDKRTPGTVSLASSFRDIRGLEYILANELEALDSAHETLIDRLQELQGQPSYDLINQTVECCLRPAKLPLKICPFCKANELFDIYENKLFSFTDKGVSEVSGLEGESIFQVGTRRQGTWADSETERILKCVISFTKGFMTMPRTPDGRSLGDVGGTHLKIFDVLKKEFKVIRTLWIELRAQVSAHDELDMATTRLRLRLQEEPVPDPPQPNVLEPAEFDSQRLKVQSDRIIAQNMLRKKLGQLMYLNNLAKASTEMEGGENPEPCPICQRTLGKKWAVLTCGHCYCLDCVRLLVAQCSVGGPNARLKCPMCRQGSRYADINYVSTSSGPCPNETPIKGDHSTKVEGVVRYTLQILKEDPSTKILVFSMWQNVLNILSQAFTDNDVRHVSLLANNKFQRNLSNFKTRDDISVLLLPVHSGANGLNLIEATHVILVEPILNHGQELQAIGRVHRIGQSKPTFVHRFLVRGTIEERLHHLLAVRAAPVTASTSADYTPFTVTDLRALYMESQLNDPDLDNDDDDMDEEEEEDYAPQELANQDSDTRQELANQDGDAPQEPANQDRDIFQELSNQDRDTPQVSANPDRDTPQVSTNPDRDTPQVSANPDRDTPQESANPDRDIHQEMANENRDIPQDPTIQDRDTLQHPSNQDRNIHQEVVNQDRDVTQEAANKD